MDSLECRILRLHGIDLGDCRLLERYEENGTKISLELALRSVAAEHSESPMYLVLPALRISSRAGIDSSSGVSDLISIFQGLSVIITY
jgi:hypothetical protein